MQPLSLLPVVAVFSLLAHSFPVETNVPDAIDASVLDNVTDVMTSSKMASKDRKQKVNAIDIRLDYRNLPDLSEADCYAILCKGKQTLLYEPFVCQTALGSPWPLTAPTAAEPPTNRRRETITETAALQERPLRIGLAWVVWAWIAHMMRSFLRKSGHQRDRDKEAGTRSSFQSQNGNNTVIFSSTP